MDDARREGFAGIRRRARPSGDHPTAALSCAGPGTGSPSRVRGVLAFLSREILDEFGLSENEAALAASMLYGGFGAIAAYSTEVPTRRTDIERVIRAIVTGGLDRLAGRR